MNTITKVRDVLIFLGFYVGTGCIGYALGKYIVSPALLWLIGADD